MIVNNVWGSIMKLCRDDLRTGDWVLHDWESHAMTPELPEFDLIGPTALAVREESAQMVVVNFAIAMSVYGDDANLFRHREMAARVYERLRPERQVDYYDAESATRIGFMISVGPTTLTPMGAASSRPFQYVQCELAIDPSALPFGE